MNLLKWEKATMKLSIFLIFVILPFVFLGCGSNAQEISSTTGTPPPQVLGTAALIETAAETTSVPQISMDVTSGNAIAVWTQEYAPWTNNVYANRYVAGTGWVGAGLIEARAEDASVPQISMNASGNAVAVWRQSDGTANSIYANRYAAGWTGAVLLEAAAGNALVPQISMNASGNAIAVWRQNDGTYWSIYANRYAAGAWGGAVLLEASSEIAFDPQIFMDASGNAIAVWSQWDGTYYSIYANRYAAGAWGGAVLLETAIGDTYYPQISMDASGNAIAVWSQPDGAPNYTNSIYANRYASGWTGAVLLETAAGSAYVPQISMDASGNAIAVWSQWDAYYSIYANRYVAGTGWGTAALIESATGNASVPQISMDATSGNAVAVWSQWDWTYDSIYANRYTSGTGWGTAGILETAVGTASVPQISIDASSNAIAVWSQWDGTYYSIWANRF